MYSQYKAYNDSKLCQVVSTKHFETLMRAEGANVSFYAVHPGIVPTDILSSYGMMGKCMKGLLSCFRVCFFCFSNFCFIGGRPSRSQALLKNKFYLLFQRPLRRLLRKSCLPQYPPRWKPKVVAIFKTRRRKDLRRIVKKKNIKRCSGM